MFIVVVCVCIEGRWELGLFICVVMWLWMVWIIDLMWVSGCDMVKVCWKCR